MPSLVVIGQQIKEKRRGHIYDNKIPQPEGAHETETELMKPFPAFLRCIKGIKSEGLLVRMHSLLFLCLNTIFRGLLFNTQERKGSDNSSFYAKFCILFHFEIYLVQREPSILTIFIFWRNYGEKAY